MTLQSLSVSPATSTIAKGTAQALAATALYSDGSEQDVSASASWATSDASVLALGAPAGGPVTAMGMAVGAAQVSATLSGVSGSATVQVTAAVAQSLTVNPSSASVATGVLQAFTAVAHFSDGTDQDVSTSATWLSSDAAVASITAFGVAQGLTVGSTTVTASFQGSSASAALDVTAAAVTSLSVQPATATLAAGTTRQLSVTATFTDGTTLDVTDAASWDTSDHGVATISSGAGAGLVSAVAVGSTLASASYSGFAASSRLTVSAATLQTLVVSSDSESIPLGLDQPFTATGIFSDHSQQDLTDQVSWAVGDTNIATVSMGIVHPVAAGSTTITVSLAGVTGVASVTVTAATLESIDLFPAVASAAQGTTVAFSAIGNYSDGTTQELTVQAAWTSDVSGVVFSGDAGSEGVAAASAVGTATVTATFGGVSGTAVMAVTPAVLRSILVTPATIAVPNGFQEQLTAIGTFSDATTQDLTTQAAWISSDSQVAAVSNGAGSKGLVTTLGEGAATVTATLFGISGSSVVTVTPAVLDSIVVTPSTATVPAGYKVQFNATANYSDGASYDVTAQATWTSSDAAIATVSTTGTTRGLATGVAAGSASIIATLDGVTGHGTLDVVAARLESLSIEPSSFTLAPRGTQALRAIGAFTDQTTHDQITLDITNQCVWRSYDKSIAWVSKKGIVTGVQAGSVTIAAKRTSKSATATGTVE